MNFFFSFLKPSRGRALPPQAEAPVPRQTNRDNEGAPNCSSQYNNDFVDTGPDEAAQQQILSESAKSSEPKADQPDTLVLTLLQPDQNFPLFSVTKLIDKLDTKEKRFKAVSVVKDHFLNERNYIDLTIREVDTYKKDNRPWEAGNCTEADLQAEHPEFQEMSKCSEESLGKLGRRDKKMILWSEQRNTAFRGYFETRKDKTSVAQPSCTMSFLKLNGMTMLPCGIIGSFKDDNFSPISLSYEGETRSFDSTSKVLDGGAAMPTRNTPRKSAMAVEAFSYEIPNSDEELLPSPTKPRKRKAKPVPRFRVEKKQKQ
ncbi:hypothetical protein ACHAO8_011357 [Botrytis cinerea]